MSKREDAERRLEAAMTEYLALQVGHDQVQVTDYVMCLAGIDLSVADDRVHYTSAYSGPPHVRIGLASILADDIDENAFPGE